MWAAIIATWLVIRDITYAVCYDVVVSRLFRFKIALDLQLFYKTHTSYV